MRRQTIHIRAPRLAAALFATAVITVLALTLPSAAFGWGRMPQSTHITYGDKAIVDIPESIPHDPGDRIDRRLLPQLRYLSERFVTFFIADGYAGKPHEKYGEHPLGLAVDVVPSNWDGKGCDGSWQQISRIARWAEPRHDNPRPPFRWVGYNHDPEHGCGDHLHLSWSHAPQKPFHKADWVELFDVPSPGPVRQATPPRIKGMRRPALLALFIALATALGCGSADEDSTPVACLNGSKPYSAALQKAPRAVRLDGETPISDCLVRNQSAGDLAQIGTILVGLTTDLNSEARNDPAGAPTVQLGYLIGAVQRGADQTSGIHAELVRRLEAAALFSPAGKPPPPPFDQTYEKGYAAGRDDG